MSDDAIDPSDGDEWTEEKVAEIYERMKNSPLLDVFGDMFEEYLEKTGKGDELKDNLLMQTIRRRYEDRHD